MKIHRPAFFLIFAVSFGVFAGNWEFSYHPANVSYATYGSSLGDPTSPSKSDKKIAFEVKGQAAWEIFEAIGPDRRDSCFQMPDMHFRSRDDGKLVCTKTKEGEYACYFDFDFKSGKSIGGSIC